MYSVPCHINIQILRILALMDTLSPYYTIKSGLFVFTSKSAWHYNPEDQHQLPG
jgi:hypothetical protein